MHVIWIDEVNTFGGIYQVHRNRDRIVEWHEQNLPSIHVKPKFGLNSGTSVIYLYASTVVEGTKNCISSS